MVTLLNNGEKNIRKQLVVLNENLGKDSVVV